MERKIGEIFEYNGEWYQCVEGNGCENCAFNGRKCYTFTDNNDPIGDCCADRRKDNKDVIFKKLEKVGEPFERNGYMYQEYKAHTYPLLMSGGAKIPTYNGFAVIIKQNKDMEEYKMYDAKEDIPEFDKVVDECLFGKDKLNLKPFDIQKAREGKPVCTRDGRKARIICFDAKDTQPIIGLYEKNIDGIVREYLCSYHTDGRMYDDQDTGYDLMMLPEKKEGWVNVYKDSVYDTKDEAIDATYEGRGYIDTVKVSWEE